MSLTSYRAAPPRVTMLPAPYERDQHYLDAKRAIENSIAR